MKIFYLIIMFFLSTYCYAEIKTDENCNAMKEYAVLKYREYAEGEKLNDIIEREEKKEQSEKNKRYKILVLDVLDTFPIWNKSEETRRVEKDLAEYIYSVCDGQIIGDVFKLSGFYFLK